MPVSNVILIQWQKCEIFLIKPLLSVIFHDKSKHIETTQETNTELSFSLTLRKISKYLFLFCPHKSKIFILHSFSAEWFKIKTVQQHMTGNPELHKNSKVYRRQMKTDL